MRLVRCEAIACERSVDVSTRERTTPPASRIAALQHPPLGPRRDAQGVGGLDVEAPGPRLLDERPADGRHPVADRKRLEPVSWPREDLARLDLDELQRIVEPAEDAAESPEQLVQPGRPVDGQRQLAAAEGERLEHERETPEVIRVVVGQEDLLQLGQADRGAQELALGALGAVDQEPLPAPPQQERRWGPLGRGHRGRSAQENEVEIHEIDCKVGARTSR